LVPVPIARLVLEKMGPIEREEVVWKAMCERFLGIKDAFAVRLALPHLDLVPSRRIVHAIVSCHRDPRVLKTMRPGEAEDVLARVRAVADTSPAVAEALDFEAPVSPSPKP